jgi:DNA-binding transcriptional LysR family regulator
MSGYRIENINWNRLKSFYYVAKEGSIVRAAEVLNISQPALSRSIQLLEHSFKKELLYRHSRGVSLTYSGTKIFQTTERIMGEMSSLLKVFNDNDHMCEETLKISIPPYLASAWFYKKLNHFLSLYPQLHLEIKTNMQNLENMDILIGKKFSEQRELVKLPLPFLTMEIGLFASGTYLQNKDIPLTCDDLDHHNLIAYEDTIQLPYDDHPWILNIGKKIGQMRKPYMVVSSLEGLISAAKEGLGIVELPIHMPEITEAQLIPVLPNIEKPMMKTYFSYYQHMGDSKWIIALKDYLKDLNS